MSLVLLGTSPLYVCLEMMSKRVAYGKDASEPHCDTLYIPISCRYYMTTDCYLSGLYNGISYF